MPIDWDNVDLDSIVNDAAATTDDHLSSQISSLTRMTDAEVKALFPNPADVKKLADLMKIVKSAEDRNIKINKITQNAEQFTGVMLTLVDKFV